ncbi:MAG: TatD family hydrolase [Labilithrix sp.]|nr:TatD family hydrolase [Labilithrix sp.]MCW5816322.1 TatD family hydrolase [Labilithrix sp.]
MSGLFDIAGNLTNKAFREDLPAVLDRAAAAGVRGIVVAGVSTSTSRRGWQMAADERRPGLTLVATSGIHPHHASDASREALAEIAELARKERVVAVGECGLDYNRNFSPPEAQRRAFEAQLEIAAELGKPVYLHERDAHEDFTRILERWRPKLAAGVVHCFTGTRAILERYLALDLHIGITGWICDERRGRHLEDLAKLVPRGRLMVETDCPYILPRDMKPKPSSGRNEPAFVAHVARAVARHRGETFEDLAAHTTETARALFRC